MKTFTFPKRNPDRIVNNIHVFEEVDHFVALLTTSNPTVYYSLTKDKYFDLDRFCKVAIKQINAFTSSSKENSAK